MANSTIAEKIAQAETEQQRIATNIAAAYDEAEAKGATMPATENSANLAKTVASIPTGTAPTLITKQFTENGTYTAAQDGADGYSEVTVAVPDASIAILDSLIDGTITKINSNVTKIRNNAFSASSLESAIFPFATTIGNNGFLGVVSLTSVSFPSVTYIGTTSFQGCIRLPRAVFPKVTEISNGAFIGCTALTTIVLNSRAVARSTSIVPSHTIVYVENDDLEWYSTATNWSALYANGQIKSIDELPSEEVPT